MQVFSDEVEKWLLFSKTVNGVGGGGGGGGAYLKGVQYSTW